MEFGQLVGSFWLFSEKALQRFCQTLSLSPESKTKVLLLWCLEAWTYQRQVADFAEPLTRNRFEIQLCRFVFVHWTIRVCVPFFRVSSFLILKKRETESWHSMQIL